MSEIINDGKVVLMHYTLTSPAGDVIDTSEGREPMAYLHGAGNIVPGLERQLTGKQSGDRVNAIVPPEEGYGQRREEGAQLIPRDAFPPDIELEAGMQFVMQGEREDQVVPFFVVGLQGDQVLIDINHPLAGMTLHFDVEVVGVREATREERQHGHPHGADGHDHSHGH